MPNEIDRTSSAQRRSSRLLTAMAIFICLGIAAYMVLTLLVNRQTPATPDTHYTGTNGVSVYYDSSVWSVCRMTEDPTLGTVLELATADTADSEDYQAVLLQQERKTRLLELAAPLELPPPSEREQQFQALWTQFYKTLEIKARHNEKGRMTHCPKRFWADMVEMKEKLQ
mgnify:CR=1 FL=1